MTYCLWINLFACCFTHRQTARYGPRLVAADTQKNGIGHARNKDLASKHGGIVTVLNPGESGGEIDSAAVVAEWTVGS